MIEITAIKHNNTMLWNNWASVDAPVVSCTDNVVTMTCSTNGATIHYSTNGGTTYSVYSTPITISAQTTYIAYATKSGMNDSVSTTYTAIYKTPIESPLRIDKRSDVGTRTVSLTKNGNAPEINLEYSFNNSTWQTWTPDSSGNRTMSLPANTSMFIRGNNPNGLAGSTGDDFYSFSCDKNYGIAGDIRSLVSHYEVDTLPYMCFRGLFKNSTTLSAADYSRIESTNLGRYCYSQMFFGCTNLLRAPHNLPASIVSERAYDYMFYGCTSLEVMPIIAATTFGKNACRAMFYGCTSLTQQWTSTTPSVGTRGNIGFTIASSDTNSFQDMFRGCSSLVNASGITATQTNNWKESVCNAMFRDCSALTSAPSITFGSFASGSSHCQGMFHGCTSLVSTPNIHLNAPTLYGLTYKNMYYGCTHLTTAPEIKATTMFADTNNGSLAIMFYNCSSLTYIKVNFTNWNSGNYTNSWTYGLPSSGRFDCPSGLAQTKNASGNTTNPHYIPYNWGINQNKLAKPTVSCSNNVVTMSCSTSGATIKYSTNGGSSYSTYSSPITISATTTYTVYATKSGMFDSDTTTYTATYTAPKLPDPTITFSYVNGINKATIETPGISGVTYYVNKATGNSALSCSDINAPNAHGTSQFRGTGTGDNSTFTINVAEYVRHCGIKVLSVKSGYRDSDITCKTYDH